MDASDSASRKQRYEHGPQPLATQTTSWLSETNVVMKQIDLSCRIIAPAVAGFLLGSASPSWHSGSTDHDSNPSDTSIQTHDDSGARDLANAALLVGTLNFISLAIEYFCTARIYHLVPELAVTLPVLPTAPRSLDCPSFSESRHSKINSDSVIKQHVASATASHCTFVSLLPVGLVTYWRQPIVWAGVGLSLLFLNALTFGGLMTTYLVWRGMSLESVGWWRGVSAAVGLLGTYAFRYSTQRFTLVTTGLWSVLYQLLFISISFVSLFFTDARYDTVSMMIFVGGVCLSRIGLWVFDITITQLMQEFIPDGIRGVVGGTQQSLNAFFQLSSFALGLLFPDPRDFPIYTATGYAAVCVAALTFYIGVYLRQDEFTTRLEKLRPPQP